MANNPSSLDTCPERETRRAADAAERIIAHWQATIHRSTQTN